MEKPHPTEGKDSAPIAIEPRQRRWLGRLALFIAILAICGMLDCPALIGAWVWFSPVKSGESRTSPDDRYEASVYNVHSHADHYVEIEVVEIASGRQIWYVVQRYAPDVKTIAYEARDLKFADWAADSKSVSIPVAGGRTLTFDVP